MAVTSIFGENKAEVRELTHIENHPLVGRWGGPERPELGRKSSLIDERYLLWALNPQNWRNRK